MRIELKDTKEDITNYIKKKELKEELKHLSDESFILLKEVLEESLLEEFETFAADYIENGLTGGVR